MQPLTLNHLKHSPDFVHGFWHSSSPFTTMLDQLGNSHSHVSMLKQVHSPTCKEIRSTADIDAEYEGDAQVTRDKNILLAVRTADCVPVLFADAMNKVVGIAHAGSTGALRGVIAATTEKMCEVGAVLDQIQAIIGPCIRQASYEVGLEFVSKFLLADMCNGRFFEPSETDKQKCLFDLPGYVKALLRDSGVHTIRDMEIDTFSDPKFFSYRRATKASEKLTGHNLSFIGIK